MSDGVQPAIPGAVPARGYSWAPFGPGNGAALKHGADSPKVIEPLALELLPSIHESGPEYLADPSYGPKVWRYAWTLARWLLLSVYVHREAELDSKGNPRPAASQLDRVGDQLERLEKSLGLSPDSRAHLTRELAAAKTHLNLEKLRAEGARLVEAAEERMRKARGDDAD